MKRIILFIAILCSLSVSAQRTYKIEGLPQRFTTALGVPIKSSSFYNTSSDSAVIFFDPADTSTLFFKYKGLSKKLAGSRVPWDSITGIPSNFSTTYALSNDVQDSIQARIRTSVAAATYTPITRFLDSLTNIQSRIQSKLTKSDADTYYPAIQRMLDSLTAVQGRVQTKEPFISPGTSAQYWRGDKSWQTLDKSAVGLSAVPNVDATNPANISQSELYRFVTDTEKSTWNAKQSALGYTPENAANKGIANGYADLDAGGKIPASRIDFGQTGQTFVVASQSAMLAVSGANIGALAIRTDENKNYRLIAQPASTLANWQVLLSPDAPVQSVNGFTGNVNLLTTHISEGSNYWWTAARSRAAQSLTVSGSSGSATYDNTTGVLNIPTYTLAGLGGQPALSGTGFVKISGTTITYDNSTYLTSYTETDPTIYAWAKATTKPSYSWGEITGTVPTWNQNTTGTAASLSAVLSSTLGGAGAVNGILKANGSGTVSAVVASDITSLISGTYLPLSGGTLTGGLSGTTASFSGNTNADDYNMAAWKILDWSSVTAQIGGIQASQWQSIDFYTNGSIRQSLSNTLATFNVPISGTSLSMSGGGSFASKVYLGLDGTYGSTYSGIAFQGTSAGVNGENRIFAGNGGADGLYIAAATGRGIYFRANGGIVDNVNIASDGSLLVNTLTTDGTNKLIVNGSAFVSATMTASLFSKANTSSGNTGTPFFDNIAQYGSAGFRSFIQGGNEYNSTTGSYLRFVVNGISGVNDLINIMLLSPYGNVNFYSSAFLGASGTRQGQVTLHSTTANAEGNIYGRTGGGMLLNTNGNNFPIQIGGSELIVNPAITASSIVTATGFIKSGSSDSYFLLGGGGHVATSTYATTASLSSYVNTTGNQYEIGGNKSFLGAVEVVSLKTTGGPGTPGVLKFGGKTNDTVFTAGSQYVLPVNIDGTTYYIRLWAGVN